MEKLGIDSTLVVVQIINFGLLLLVLKKVLYQPVIKALKERETKLDEITSSESKMDKKRQEFENEKAILLKSVTEEKKRIEKETKRQSEEARKIILEKANKDAKDIIKSAHREVERQVDSRIKELEKEMKVMAMKSVKLAIADFMDKESQEQSIAKASKTLEKIKFDGIN